MTLTEQNFLAIQQRLQAVNGQLSKRDAEVKALQRQVQGLIEANADLQARMGQVLVMVAGNAASAED